MKDRSALTIDDAIIGFPLSERERKALDELTGEGARLPKGVAAQTRQNLLGRRIGVDESYEPVYVTTPEGIIAVQLDDIALARGSVRPSPLAVMSRPGAYHNLNERLEYLRTMGA
jgi:hypothetical protein